ncbi:MAG: type II toxin-antitoxin system HicA family toxin [DPANN group archaeon]|nr:type II toxin-antitoxin system HicA family toxin [DPANN group archaeon]
MGFEFRTQRGSHIKLIKDSERKLVVTVVNEKEIKKKTLISICKQARISRARLYELIKKSEQ